jgi:sugar phosphate isomerase/epimerase
MINCPTINHLQFLESPTPSISDSAAHVVLTTDFPTALEGLAGQFAEKIKAANLKFLALTLDGAGLFSLLTPDETRRAGYLQHLTTLIRWAAQLPCETCLILPADRPFPDNPVSSYEDAFNLAFFAISRLSAESAAHGLTLALENPAAGLFLSPLELRDFIDQINSPFLGVCFNPLHAAALGRPADWFAILDRRITLLRLPDPHTAPNPLLADFLSLPALHSSPLLAIFNE